MKIVISEHQRNLMIPESVSDNIEKNLRKNKEIGDEILKSMSNTIGMDLKMLFTYSCAIGGFIRPLNEFLSSGEFNLTKEESILVFSAIVASYFLDNSKIFSKIISKIKELNLESAYELIENKAKILLNVFFGFLDSLGNLTAKVSNMVAYTFLIPIIGTILEFAQNNNFSGWEEITKRILASGLVNLSGIMVKEIIRKIVKRFSN